MKTTSCGVLIFNEHGQLLMAHATGQRHWDIPKGGVDEGETPRQTAVREVQEETGIVLNAQALEDIGHMAYTSRKDLHLFRIHLHTRDCDIALCKCTSFFPHHLSGEMVPEADRFKWVDVQDIPQYAAKSMTAALRSLAGFETMGPSAL
jgi:8-oxo-dGTP pyrophosphatase MutT (NUDIX family)